MTELAATNHSALDTTAAELDQILTNADHASHLLRNTTGETRAAWLESVAVAIEEREDELVSCGAAETHLPAAALRGEVNRTAFQLRHLAKAACSPTLLDVQVEEQDEAYPVAPRPSLVRAHTPLGPVLVFTASNFPFAFSVAGNDTASAIAAGCPVVVKANPGHPILSAQTAAIVAEALTRCGAPIGTFSHIQGFDAGVEALRDERIMGCGFTGSVAGGRALFDIANARPTPIPFFGELGSLNPVIVTEGAAQSRAESIANGFTQSLTFRAGQLCTKPGILFAPRSSAIAELAANAMKETESSTLLTDRITDAFLAGITRLTALPGAKILAGGTGTEPTLASVPAGPLVSGEIALEEYFGPAAVIVEYADSNELVDLLKTMPGNLTATIHAEQDDQTVAKVIPVVAERAGRLIWNGWPTGVSVTAAMHHGGPYPATTSPNHGSIGATSARRWLRPIAFQNWPVDALPPAIREALPNSPN